MDESFGVASICAIGNWEGSGGGTVGITSVRLSLSSASIDGNILSVIFYLCFCYLSGGQIVSRACALDVWRCVAMCCG